MITKKVIIDSIVFVVAFFVASLLTKDIFLVFLVTLLTTFSCFLISQIFS